MEIYNALYDEDLDNVYAISLVGRPAMKGQLTKLSEQTETKLATVNSDRREVMGMVLEPNKVIPRIKDGGGVYGIVFKEEVIRNLSRDFFKKKKNDKSTIGHKGAFLEKVSFVESWIVEDSEKDKSAAYGLNYPKGTWMATMKIDDENLWNKYVESGEVTGFSIDSVLKFEKLKQIEMSEQVKEKTFKESLNEFKTELLEDLSKLNPWKKVEVSAKDLETTELEEVEKPKDEPKQVELSDEIKTVIFELVQEATEPLKADLEKAKKLNEALETELAEEKAKVIELAKKPATEKIVQKKVVKEYKDMTPAEQMAYNRSK